MGEEYAIELRGVKKSFEEVVAVERFDVGIRKGEFFSLLGPSGCGKTTTLRLIAGLEEPTEGAILLEGREVNRVPAYRRNVHTVFQDYALFPHMDVRRNVWFPLKMRGVSLAEAEKRIERVLRLVSMEGFERRSSFPEGSGSASPWPAPWWTRRPRCSWTSRSAPWTSSCAWPCRRC
jgi:spermidine/putrescine transport system ATP-binding protein